MNFHEKFQPSTSSRLGCRGGQAKWGGAVSSSKLSQSVQYVLSVQSVCRIVNFAVVNKIFSINCTQIKYIPLGKEVDENIDEPTVSHTVATIFGIS